jgi:small membrane protein
MIIRIVLLAGLAAIAWFVFLRRNRMPFHIVTVFALLGAGAVAVVVPETTDAVANFVGVGRGADLVTYISIVAILFVLVHYFSKFVELQRNLTHLTRELAILRADLDHVANGPNTVGATPPTEGTVNSGDLPSAAVQPSNTPS